MKKGDPSNWDPATQAIRGAVLRSELGEHSESIYLTSSYVFANAAEAAARFKGEESGHVYSRYTNPSVEVLEKRIALLEGGSSCIATASGMSAILALCLSYLQSGDHVVVANGLFGTTINLFDNVLDKLGIKTTFVSLVDYVAWKDAITPKTKMFFLETPSNPLTEIADIKKLASIAHKHGVILAVDNCFATPILQKPLTYGADVVVHSATKYFDGQGRCLGGAIVFGEAALFIRDAVFAFMRTAGPTLSPFNAWVILKGLETLEIRMLAISERASQLAVWLSKHPMIKQVFYPGLPSHPQHRLAKIQQNGFGGIISFEIVGGQATAWKLIDRLHLFSITVNLGDSKSTIAHPATTTHSRLTAAQRADAGVIDGLLRISVGLESLSDLQDDLAIALASLH